VSTEPATKSVGDHWKTEVWNGFKKGDRVRVTTERLQKGRRTTFEFLCYTRNVKTDREWIEIFGGPQGHESIHAVGLSEVRKVVR
jgi:hypothetical protein